MKKKLLLHSCCGPCSTVVIERLIKDFDVTVFFCNPNIFPQQEFEKREAEQIKVCTFHNVPIVDCGYDAQEWFDFVKGHESDKEGGARCALCFEFRLEKTAQQAKKDNFDLYATTLSVSPHKHTLTINALGENLSKQIHIDFLSENFKKQAGYLRSVEISKELDLYRQNYCGCKFSIRE